jgi:hypothetical protein
MRPSTLCTLPVLSGWMLAHKALTTELGSIHIALDKLAVQVLVPLLMPRLPWHLVCLLLLPAQGHISTAPSLIVPLAYAVMQPSLLGAGCITQHCLGFMCHVLAGWR